MKTTVLGICNLIILVVTIIIVANISNTKNRDVNLKDNVKETLETSLSSILEQKNYSITNQDELIADLTATMASYLSSGTELEIKIRTIDETEGLLSISATVQYALETTDQTKKLESTITCEKTVFLDKEDPMYIKDQKQEQTFKLTYQLADDPNPPLNYKLYTLTDEPLLKLPPTPKKEGFAFQGWKESVTGTIYGELELKTKTLDKDYQFIAVFIPK